MVAGKIIAAIATTTAAVTGLVLFELFKMVMGKDIAAFRNRVINLAVNAFQSFEPDPPATKTSGSRLTEPEAASLGPDDFDESGKVKKSSYVEEKFAAYPDKHSCWDKLVVPRDMALGELVAWFASEHKLKLNSWALKHEPYVYPPKPSVDPAHLPALDLPQNKAFMEIRANAAVAQKDKMTVLGAWQKAKATGQMPVARKSTLEMTITELLAEKGGVAVEGRQLLWLEGISFVGTSETAPTADTAPGSLEGVDIEVPEVYLSL